MEFSKKQKQVFDMIMDFFFNQKSAGFVLSGVAGSGKTTIVKKIFNVLSDDLKLIGRCVAPTGKAASLLPKGSTIHSLIYEPVYDDDDNLIGFNKKPFLGYDFLIVDEAGMIDSMLFEDLMSYRVPILFVGDKEQLPPIKKGFSIMDSYDYHLDEIHRVAEGNPIIQLSRELRETGKINPKYADGNMIRLIRKEQFTRGFVANSDHNVVVCGTNEVRRQTNRLSRVAKGFFEDHAEEGEQIVSLRNNSDDGNNFFANGEMFRVRTHSGVMDGERQYYLKSLGRKLPNIYVHIDDECWVNESHDPENRKKFAFAYAMTCHKMQGSQMPHVAFYDEDVSFFLDRRRFRYTAITRASEKLTIIR